MSPIQKYSFNPAKGFFCPIGQCSVKSRPWIVHALLFTDRHSLPPRSISFESCSGQVTCLVMDSTAGKTFWRVFLPLAHFPGFHFIMASASLRCSIGDSIELSRALRQTLAQSNAFSGRSTSAKQTRSHTLGTLCKSCQGPWLIHSLVQHGSRFL